MYYDLIKVYPNLDIEIEKGNIELRNDSDGKGAYIYKWECKDKIPDGFKVGRIETKVEEGEVTL